MKKRSFKTPAPESLEDIVREYDRAARDAAWKWRGVAFDHSRGSIETLEEMLGELYDELHRPSLKRKLGLGPGEVDIEQWANLWGIYIGESLRSGLGGRWITGHEEAPNLLAVEFPDGTVIFPTAKVFRRLSDGERENVLAYYDLVKESIDEGEHQP
jgi:hypothetical protein